MSMMGSEDKQRASVLNSSIDNKKMQRDVSVKHLRENSSSGGTLKNVQGMNYNLGKKPPIQKK